ncbi:hypothetical protein ACQP2U_28885 [Nocardia sp. CA-084685]
MDSISAQTEWSERRPDAALSRGVEHPTDVLAEQVLGLPKG